MMEEEKINYQLQAIWRVGPRSILRYEEDTVERFSIAFTANGKRQAEISRLPWNLFVFSLYFAC